MSPSDITGCDPNSCGCQSSKRLIRLETREEVDPTEHPGTTGTSHPAPYDAARRALREAEEKVTGPRSEHYGHPLDNHERTARLWTAHLRNRGLLADDDELTPEDVCWMNGNQKQARDCNAPIADTPVDLAGYAANLAEVRAERTRRMAEALRRLCGDEPSETVA